MIFFTSSIAALKIPTPATLLPSEIGQTIDNTPSARSAKFLRPCSQMIFSTPSSFFFGPAFKITMQYFLVVDSICRINSSVIVVIEVSSKKVYFTVHRGCSSSYSTRALKRWNEGVCQLSSQRDMRTLGQMILTHRKLYKER